MTQHCPRHRLNHHLTIALLGGLLGLVYFSCLPADDIIVKKQTLKQIEQDYGNYARQRVLVWHQLIDDHQDAPARDKLELVNNFFNQLAFVNDSELWGQEDYWATPLQMLSSNGGDCEDFSIAKYFTLRKMGIPEEHMRLTYVKALQLDQAHMVLTYFPSPDAEPLVLDNLVSEIQPSSERTDLQPVYSFNGKGLWLAKMKGADRRIGHSGRLSRWQGVIARINDEQIPITQ